MRSSSTCRTSAFASTLTLHHGALPARLRPPRGEGDRLRSPESNRRRRRRRADARTGLRVVRRPVPDPDAPWPDDRRAGAALQRAVCARSRSRGDPDGGLVARHVLRRHWRPVGDAVTQYPDARHGHRLPWRRALRGDDDLRGPRDDTPVRADRRTVDSRRALCCRAECAASRRRHTSGQPSSSPRFRSTPGHRAGAARSMCWTAPCSARARPRRRCCSSATAPTRHEFEWREPPYEYEATKMPIDILAGSPALRQQIEAQVPLEDIVESWQEDVAAFEETRAGFLLY